MQRLFVQGDIVCLVLHLVDQVAKSLRCFGGIVKFESGVFSTVDFCDYFSRPRTFSTRFSPFQEPRAPTS